MLERERAATECPHIKIARAGTDQYESVVCRECAKVLMLLYHVVPPHLVADVVTQHSNSHPDRIVSFESFPETEPDSYVQPPRALRVASCSRRAHSEPPLLIAFADDVEHEADAASGAQRDPRETDYGPDWMNLRWTSQWCRERPAVGSQRRRASSQQPAVSAQQPAAPAQQPASASETNMRHDAVYYQSRANRSRETRCTIYVPGALEMPHDGELRY